MMKRKLLLLGICFWLSGCSHMLCPFFGDCSPKPERESKIKKALWGGLEKPETRR